MRAVCLCIVTGVLLMQAAYVVVVVQPLERHALSHAVSCGAVTDDTSSFTPFQATLFSHNSTQPQPTKLDTGLRWWCLATDTQQPFSAIHLLVHIRTHTHTRQSHPVQLHRCYCPPRFSAVQETTPTHSYAPAVPMLQPRLLPARDATHLRISQSRRSGKPVLRPRSRPSADARRARRAG